MSICLQKVEIDGHTVQLFQDEENGKITGYSFAHDKYYPDPLGQLPDDFEPVRFSKTDEEILEEIAEIASYPTLALPDRKLRKETLLRFGIKTGVSEVDGETITTIHFPSKVEGSVTGYKTKLIDPKRFWSVGEVVDADLFGWEQALASGSNKLFIVEGELDVAATYQMLKDNAAGGKWADLEPAIVSVPNGAGAAKTALSKRAAVINAKFEYVVLAFDMDKAGQEAVEECVRTYPEATAATLPANDPNACLMEGRPKAFCRSVLFKSTKPKNTKLLDIGSLFTKARTPMEEGLSYPWQGITDLTRGMYFGQTVYITAPEKVGKSELLNALVAHLVKEHDIKCFLMKPEEDPIHTVKLLAGKMEGKFFNDPDVEFDYDAFDRATALLSEHVEILDIYQELSWETMQVDIRSAASEGCKAIFIDPLTAVTTGLSASDANTKLQEISQGLSLLAKDLDVIIFIFTHTRNPRNGPAFNRGGQIEVGDITGGRAMGRSAHQVFALQSNQDPELPIEERNIRELVLLADRNQGSIGKVKLYWDRFTSLFSEMRVT